MQISITQAPLPRHSTSAGHFGQKEITSSLNLQEQKIPRRQTLHLILMDSSGLVISCVMMSWEEMLSLGRQKRFRKSKHIGVRGDTEARKSVKRKSFHCKQTTQGCSQEVTSMERHGFWIQPNNAPTVCCSWWCHSFPKRPSGWQA